MAPYMIVDDVSDEYQHVRTQICDGCGFSGSYKVIMQRLVEIDGKPHDVLECKCKECGAERAFTYDVSVVFGRYGDMFGKRAKRSK